MRLQQDPLSRPSCLNVAVEGDRGNDDQTNDDLLNVGGDIVQNETIDEYADEDCADNRAPN